MTETFPDLHTKMSKKIAQLTKVIYHLNTKNEDHQTEIDYINKNHQSELQQILRDATAKISKFKEAVEGRQAMVTINMLFYRLILFYECTKRNYKG